MLRVPNRAAEPEASLTVSPCFCAPLLKTLRSESGAIDGCFPVCLTYGLLEEPDELSGVEPLPEELPELLPDELPSEPPIPEVGFTPKYENTLCFQPGCDRVVVSKEGADCNLLVSPLKTNVC